MRRDPTLYALALLRRQHVAGPRPLRLVLAEALEGLAWREAEPPATTPEGAAPMRPRQQPATRTTDSS